MQNSRARHSARARAQRGGRTGGSAYHPHSGRHRSPRAPRKRTALLSSVAIAGAAGVGAPLANAGTERAVTLSVDGVAYKVKTSGGTVGEVLASQNIHVGRRDAVAPAPDTAVGDGLRIAVRHARALNLTVDGAKQSYWVTALRVGPALDEIGRRFAGAELSSSRSARIGRQGLHLTVRTPKNITLVRRGEESVSTTRAVTVGEALDDLGVRYDGDDKIAPGPDARIDDGSRIRLVRMETKTRKVEVTLPNDTVVREDPDMYKGKEKVLREGHDGKRIDTYEIVTADGRQRSRTRVAQDVRVKPVDRIEVHGTKKRPAPDPATTASSGGAISSAPCPDGSAVESGLVENGVAVYRAVCAKWPELTSYGGYRAGDSGYHGSGQALDIMIPSSSVGDEIAAWLQANHKRLGVSELIWEQHIWTVQRSSEGWRAMEDRGSVTANHYDHVHVSVY